MVLKRNVSQEFPSSLIYYNISSAFKNEIDLISSQIVRNSWNNVFVCGLLGWKHLRGNKSSSVVALSPPSRCQWTLWSVWNQSADSLLPTHNFLRRELNRKETNPTVIHQQGRRCQRQTDSRSTASEHSCEEKPVMTRRERRITDHPLINKVLFLIQQQHFL